MAQKPSKISDAVTQLWNQNHKRLQTILGQGAVNALSAHQPTLRDYAHAKQEPTQDDAKRAMQAQRKRERKQQRNLKHGSK